MHPDPGFWQLADADDENPGFRDGYGLRYMQNSARDRKNVFAALMEAMKTPGLAQISHAPCDGGGEYRRSM